MKQQQTEKLYEILQSLFLTEGQNFFHSQAFHHFKEAFGRSENRPIQGLKVYLLFFELIETVANQPNN